MQRSRQLRSAPKPSQKAKLNNFSPLLLALRAGLGSDWCFYKDFLERAVAAKARGEDLYPHIKQIEPLVQDSSLRIAHEGVAFLLGELRLTAQSESKNFLDICSPSFRPY
jgi:hypothetical protein